MYIPILKDEYEKSTEVISEEESIDSDVAEFETSPSHQEEEHHSVVYDNTDVVNSNGEIVDNFNVNASEMHAGLVADKEDVIQRSWKMNNLNMSMSGFDSRLEYVVSN